VSKSLLAILLTSLLAAVPARAAADESCGKCGKQSYGTSIEWSGSPSEAAAKAKKEEKLVFVLHVSGHFEDPKFT
jgi:hypothetical protein